MIAVLFDAGKRLGEVAVHDDVRIIQLGDNNFVISEQTPAKLEGDGYGVAFDLTALVVKDRLDRPTSKGIA